MQDSILSYSQKAISLAYARNFTLKMKVGEEKIISIDENVRLFTNYRKRVDRIFSKSSVRYSNDDDDNHQMNARFRNIGLLKSQVSKEWELFLDSLHRYHRNGS